MTSPTNHTAISSLLVRVRAATGPDRELDHDVHELQYGTWLTANNYIRDGDGWYSATPPMPGCERLCGPEFYTSSIDAAVALVERVRPGFSVLLAWNPERAICNVHPKPLGDMQQWAPPGEAKTPALALLAALLSSMEANDDN